MIKLYGITSPNVLKVALMLEEIGAEYSLHYVPIFTGGQFDPAFEEISPNHKVPVIVDEDAEGDKALPIFESGAILIYLAASRTMDFLIEGIEEYTGVTIVSPKAEEISTMITDKLGRGITAYKGMHGYGKRGHVSDINILFTVITRLEISRLRAEVDAIDPHAFIVMQSLKDTKGGMIKKRPLK